MLLDAYSSSSGFVVFVVSVRPFRRLLDADIRATPTGTIPQSRPTPARHTTPTTQPTPARHRRRQGPDAHKASPHVSSAHPLLPPLRSFLAGALYPHPQDNAHNAPRRQGPHPNKTLKPARTQRPHGNIHQILLPQHPLLLPGARLSLALIPTPARQRPQRTKPTRLHARKALIDSSPHGTSPAPALISGASTHTRKATDAHNALKPARHSTPHDTATPSPDPALVSHWRSIPTPARPPRPQGTQARTAITRTAHYPHLGARLLGGYFLSFRRRALDAGA
ncbi:hypothetical protein C8R44DRAFT_872134 [Mycena epipterygia]|nr:hypothetical protein C8R44DRAFT_872134 [Mycena epipterygia]